jgi:hypothetical protein
MLMPRDDKQRFCDVLNREFAPALREMGFVGSGRHFRRIRGEVIHALWIQGDKYGGRCAVNLGLHLSFLPVSAEGGPPPANEIKAAECAFTTRLAPGRAIDHWWRYGGLLRSPVRSARHLIETYAESGEPLFQRYATVEAVGDMASPDALRSGWAGAGFAAATGPRLALTLARIHQHLGDETQARIYAEVGLAQLGSAKALEAPLRQIAGVGR